MHKESKFYMRDAFNRHVAELKPGRVLDIGSVGRRPWYRAIWEAGGWTYDGLDLAEGHNVDIVLKDPWKFEIDNDSYDAVISGQMLEHNEFFWLTFLEMARVLKMGGLMIHIAPSRGPEHRDPQDCWRWYRDGMAAMAKWSGLEMVETTTDWAPEHFDYYREGNRGRLPRLRRTMRKKNTTWGDTVGIFRKVTETGQSMGMDYIRHFNSLHPAPKATTASKSRTKSTAKPATKSTPKSSSTRKTTAKKTTAKKTTAKSTTSTAKTKAAAAK